MVYDTLKGFAAIVATLAVGGFVLMGSSCLPGDPRDDDEVAGPLPEVTITLLGPVQLVQRVEAPKRLGDEPVGSAHLLRPHRLKIHLPDGGSISLVARSSFFISNHGLVESVYVRRPLKPMRSGEAIADLLRTMKELGIEPDSPMKEAMATWPDDAPGFDGGLIPLSFGSRTPAFDEVDLGVEFQADLAGGWYYLMGFGATLEARRVAEAAARLTSLSDDEAPDKPQRPEGPVEADQGAGKGLPGASITLLGSVREITGMELHPALPELFLTSRDLLKPHRLTVRLPGEDPVSLDVQGMAFVSRYGVVRDVLIRRPMEPMSFREALADLRESIAALGIEPDESMRKSMAEWVEAGAADNVEPTVHEARMDLSDAVAFRVRLGRDPHRGWYSLLIFSASDEAVRAALPRVGMPPEDKQK